MSKIDEILAEAGFPNTPEGKAAFYKEFPTKEDWESYKQMKHGGSLSGAPHNGQPTADEFFSFGDPTYGNLNIPFGNFAYGGYFEPGGMNNPNPPVLKEEPRGATKVSTVEPGYNMLGSVGSKTFYDKKADKAISSPGSGSGTSGDWKQSMISRLQSGVSPQSLVEAGHISKDAAKDFEQYYKPVYTETAQTTPATSISKPQPTPLKDQDKIDRKWFSSPGNQSQNYDSYMYPDVNSGYANPTRRYFDKKTGQEIDPAKSYTDKGDYVANFIQGAPGAEGTLKQTRINTPIGSATDNPITMAGSTGFAYGGGLPNGANEMPCMNCGGYMDDGGDVASPMNYGAFPNTEYGGMLDQSNMDEYPVFQEGGNEFEKGGSFYSLINNLKKAKKKLFSKGGDTVMQGGNATDYPGKRREEFDNAIKTNLHNSLVEEEGNSMLEQYKQMGGPQLNPQNQAYQQMLQQNINQGQAGLSQAAANLGSSTMDVFNTMGTKDKTKVKEVKAQEGIETKDTKETEVNKKAAEREKLLDQIISQYQESQKQPKRDYYPYGYAPQQYGYPAHYYNQGYGMRYFPMNYGYKHSISSSDVEALKKLANNPSSNLREFSHRHFGPWSKTKMKFGYKDQTPYSEYKGDPIQVQPRGFTEGFPAVHTVEDMPERRAAELKNKLQSLPRQRENYKDMDFEQYANDMLNPSYSQYTPPVQNNIPVQGHYNFGYKDIDEDQVMDEINAYQNNPANPVNNVETNYNFQKEAMIPQSGPRIQRYGGFYQDGGFKSSRIGPQGQTVEMMMNPFNHGNAFENNDEAYENNDEAYHPEIMNAIQAKVLQMQQEEPEVNLANILNDVANPTKISYRNTSDNKPKVVNKENVSKVKSETKPTKGVKTPVKAVPAPRTLPEKSNVKSSSPMPAVTNNLNHIYQNPFGPSAKKLTQNKVDKRKAPQSGVVVDKRTNQAYYIGDKGQAGSFPVLTGSNVESNYNPYNLIQLANNPSLRATPVGYYTLGKPALTHPDLKTMVLEEDDGSLGKPGSYYNYIKKAYKGKTRDMNPISAYGQPAPAANDLGFHRVYSDNAFNPKDPVFVERMKKLNSQNPNMRCTSYGCVNVAEASYDDIAKVFPTSDTLMVLDSKNPLDAEILKKFKNRARQKEYGGLAKAQVGVQSSTGNLGVSSNPILFSNQGSPFQPSGNAPGAAPSNISYQGASQPAYSTPESVGLQHKNIEMKGMGRDEKQVEITEKSKPKFNQEAMANWEITGADMISSGLEQISEVAPNKRNLKASTVADNAKIKTPENAISQGDTEINSGRLRSRDHTPVQFHGQSVAAYGGFMQDGGMQQQDGREQQIMQGVAQMLQQGAESEQILEQLVEMGLPEEQASEIIDTVINQLQMSEQQQPEQEQMQPAMRYGGYAMGGSSDEDDEYYEADIDEDEIDRLQKLGYTVQRY